MSSIEGRYWMWLVSCPMKVQSFMAMGMRLFLSVSGMLSMMLLIPASDEELAGHNISCVGNKNSRVSNGPG